MVKVMAKVIIRWDRLGRGRWDRPASGGGDEIWCEKRILKRDSFGHDLDIGPTPCEQER